MSLRERYTPSPARSALRARYATASTRWAVALGRICSIGQRSGLNAFLRPHPNQVKRPGPQGTNEFAGQQFQTTTHKATRTSVTTTVPRTVPTTIPCPLLRPIGRSRSSCRIESVSLYPHYLRASHRISNNESRDDGPVKLRLAPIRRNRV
jgi:hypothetical protein